MQRRLYGKMVCCMEIAETKVPPAPPNIIRAIRSGFDAIANRVYIILIPVILDLWLWLGPHIQIKGLMASFLTTLSTTPGFDPTNSEVMLPADPEIWQAAIERINLMMLLRSYPVGIPSLMSSILPLDAPTGEVFFSDVTSPISVILLSVVISLIGILFGTFYFMIVAQATFEGRVRLSRAFIEWPRKALHTLSLTFGSGGILLVLLIPAMCILSFVTIGGIPVSQIAVVILSGMLVWVLFPLGLTPLGIFTHRMSLLGAVQRSIVVVRMTLPTTALFFLIVIGIGQVLEVLWCVPGEGSWFELVGVAGHAFVSSALLAATFVYYRDADVWVQSLIRKTQLFEAK